MDLSLSWVFDPNISLEVKLGIGTMHVRLTDVRFSGEYTHPYCHYKQVHARVCVCVCVVTDGVHCIHW